MTDILQAYKKRAPGPLGFASDLKLIDEAGLFPPPQGAHLAEFASLASMILDMASQGRGTVIAFASTISGEGASFVSYNVARYLASAYSRRVLWIDANFKSPQPKLQPPRGLSLAALLAQPELACQFEHRSGMAVLPGGDKLESLVDRMSDDTCRQVFMSLAQFFDFVIVDCAPMRSSVETAMLALASDGLIAVVEGRRLKGEVVQHALSQLVARKVKLLGAVLNRREYELPKFIYKRI